MQRLVLISLLLSLSGCAGFSPDLKGMFSFLDPYGGPPVNEKEFISELQQEQQQLEQQQRALAVRRDEIRRLQQLPESKQLLIRQHQELMTTMQQNGLTYLTPEVQQSVQTKYREIYNIVEEGTHQSIPESEEESQLKTGQFPKVTEGFSAGANRLWKLPPEDQKQTAPPSPSFNENRLQPQSSPAPATKQPPSMDAEFQPLPHRKIPMENSPPPQNTETLQKELMLDLYLDQSSHNARPPVITNPSSSNFRLPSPDQPLVRSRPFYQNRQPASPLPRQTINAPRTQPISPLQIRVR